MDIRGRTDREGALVVRQAVWAVTGAVDRPLRVCRPGGIGPKTTHRAAERGQWVEYFVSLEVPDLAFFAGVAPARR